MKNQRKTLCVIGLGLFGTELARSLAKECDVLAVDKDPAAVDAISEAVQRALVLDARDYESLAAAVSADFDEAIVCFSESLEESILCTLHLKKIGIKRIWAKAATADHAAILELIGADEIIFPERESARRIAAQLVNPNLLDFVPLAENYEIAEIAPPNWCTGRSLRDLSFRTRFNAVVLAVKEFVPDRFVFLPEPDFVIKPSDVLIVIGRREDIAAIARSRAADS